jgi:hypothetical protein
MALDSVERSGADFEGVPATREHAHHEALLEARKIDPDFILPSRRSRYQTRSPFGAVARGICLASWGIKTYLRRVGGINESWS